MAARLFRILRDAPTVALLIASNLLPLAGVLWWGWRLGTVMVLYWVENGVIGVATIATIMLSAAAAVPQPAGPTAGADVDPRRRLREVLAQSGTAVFFTFHYGLFWVVHGVFVFALFAFPDSALGPGTGPTAGMTGVDWWAVGTGTIALTLYQAGAFAYWQLYRGEYRRTSPERAMFAPYPRLFVLHFTIIMGGILAAQFGQPVAALVLLVLLKTLVDLGGHLLAHSQFVVSGPVSARLTAGRRAVSRRRRAGPAGRPRR